MSKRDCYDVLGVGRDSSVDQIKKAYRKKALQYHPDRNPGDQEAEEKFKEATEAYSILSDPASRQRYDQFGHAAFDQRAGGFNAFEFGDFSGFEDIFGDIFSAFFGGQAPRSGGRGRPGRDLKYNLDIDFEEAAFGAEKDITVERRLLCETCNGSGAKEGSSPARCQRCSGSGQMTVQQGFFTISRTCPDCSGAGSVISDPCTGCRGQGLAYKKSKINVKIPAGIDHGQRLKLRGEGESGLKGGPNGDLYVQVSVRKHPFFRREDSELICEVPITYADAVLGTALEVPTLEGTTEVTVPPGTESGRVFRLRNQGIQVLGSARRGDLHVCVNIEVPKKISDERREVLERLREVEQAERAQGDEGFFGKVKKMFA